jgi:hypothetical protein
MTNRADVYRQKAHECERVYHIPVHPRGPDTTANRCGSRDAVQCDDRIYRSCAHRGGGPVRHHCGLGVGPRLDRRADSIFHPGGPPTENTDTGTDASANGQPTVRGRFGVGARDVTSIAGAATESCRSAAMAKGMDREFFK